MDHINFVSIEVDPLYPYVMLVAALICTECMIIGFMAGSKRSTIFNKQFMEDNFAEVHFKEVMQGLPKGGYPDTGNGLYSDKLSYKDWFQFNLDQRAHKNFLEQLTIVVFSILVSGIVYPAWAIGFGSLHAVARVVFTAGYRGSPKGRMIGGPFVMLSCMALIVLDFVALSVWIHATTFR